METITVGLLGHPEVRCGDVLVTLPTKNCWLLLARLAVEGPQSRELLATLLWPDADTQRGRTNLRRTLAYLRDACGRDREVLRDDRDALVIGESVEVDLHLIRRALERPLARAGLRDAIDMWRGGFLDGVEANGEELDAWLLQQRQSWQQRLSVACERYVALRADAADIGEALGAVERWLSRDPLSEAAHRERVRLHIMRGDRTAALQAYTQAAGVLSRELGVAPSQELASLAALARTEATPSGAPAPPEVPMVGRQAAHSLLATAFHHARSGEPSIALVVGEAGIGKSRLLREFVGWSQAQNAAIRSAHAFPSAHRIPYAALRELFAEALGGTGIRSTRNRAQAAIAATIGDEVRRMSARSPLLIVMDDVHWVDPDSLEVLVALGEEMRRAAARVLLVVAVRDDELQGNRTLQDWVTRMARELRLAEVAVGPLTDDQTAELVHAWPGAAGHAALTSVQAAAGRPLLILETLRFLEDGGDPTAIPPAAREFMHARLRDLPGSASKLAAAAAVIEQHAELPLLRDVAALSDAAAQDALRELLRKHVLDGAVRYAFSHELLRRAVYAALDAEQRRALHSRAAQLLDVAGGMPSEVARHAELAGNQQLAWERRMSAATEASSVGAHRVAADQLRSAIAIRPDESQGWLDLGRAEELSGRPDLAADTYRRLVERSRRSGCTDAEAAALVRLAELAGRDLTTSPSDLLADAADAAREAADVVLSAEASLAAAQVDAYRSELARAESVVDEVERAAHAIELPSLIARCLNLRAFITQQRGCWQDTLRLAREAQAAYRAIGDEIMELDSTGYELAALVFLGQWRDAARRSTRALARAQRIENPWAVSNISFVRAWALRDGGHLDEAHAVAERGRHAAAEAPFLPLEVLNAAIEGRCLRELGDVAAALRLHSLLVEQARDMDGVAYQCLAEELCADHVALDDWSQAAEWAGEAMDRWSDAKMFAHMSLPAVIAARLRAGEPAPLPELPSTRRYEVVRLHAAAIATEHVHSSKAEQLRRRALALATTLELPVDVAQLRRELASSRG